MSQNQKCRDQPTQPAEERRPYEPPNILEEDEAFEREALFGGCQDDIPPCGAIGPQS